jgi:hypothetical protein
MLPAAPQRGVKTDLDKIIIDFVITSQKTTFALGFSDPDGVI